MQWKPSWLRRQYRCGCHYLTSYSMQHQVGDTSQSVCSHWPISVFPLEAAWSGITNIKHLWYLHFAAREAPTWLGAINLSYWLTHLRIIWTNVELARLNLYNKSMNFMGLVSLMTLQWMPAWTSNILSPPVVNACVHLSSTDIWSQLRRLAGYTSPTLHWGSAEQLHIQVTPAQPDTSSSSSSPERWHSTFEAFLAANSCDAWICSRPLFALQMATPQARHPAMFPSPHPLSLSLGVSTLIDTLLLTSQWYIHEYPKSLLCPVTFKKSETVLTEVLQAFTVVNRHFTERANRFKMAKGNKVLAANSSGRWKRGRGAGKLQIKRHHKQGVSVIWGVFVCVCKWLIRGRCACWSPIRWVKQETCRG